MSCKKVPLWYAFNMNTKLHQYFYQLTPGERKEYASRAGTSVDYLQKHLIPPNRGPRKGASLAMLKRLAVASEGYISVTDAFAHFSQPGKAA